MNEEDLIAVLAKLDLREINTAIGDAETLASVDFFDRLLASSFSMVRPDGKRFDDRESFLQALVEMPRPGARRRTRVEHVVTYDNRAIVTCTVVKGEGTHELNHRNIRVFSRVDAGMAWKMVAWVTEPLLEPANSK